jgi:hypothetical protein
MELIYKICSACDGMGEVPFIPQTKPGETSITKPGAAIKCGRCKGEGYVPTGDFIPEPNKTFSEQIQNIEDPILLQIIKNKI